MENLQISNDLFSLTDIWRRLFVCLLIGTLIGLERERNKKSGEKSFAGIRTFPLISLFGFLSTFISVYFQSYIIYASLFLGFSILIGISYFYSCKNGDIGGTSEITNLLIFALGSLIFLDFILISSAISVAMIFFLSMKKKFHSFVDKVSEEDIIAALKFAIITIIIYPILPDKYFDPFNSLNPRDIWKMVVLIAGISFIGYISVKILGTGKGLKALAVLSGFVSSTAATLSFSQRSREYPDLSRQLAASSVLSSTIMFPRALLLVFFFNSELAIKILPFVAWTIFAGFFISFILFKGEKESEARSVELSNPFYLSTAIKFGLIYAAIVFLAKVSLTYVGEKGIYLASIFSGIADVDAISISLSKLSLQNLSLNNGSVGLLLAFLTNTFVKFGITLFLGDRKIRIYSLKGFGTIILAFLISIIFLTIFNF